MSLLTLDEAGVGLAYNMSLGQAGENKGGKGTTRVGRWMSQEEYDKMISTGKVQMSGDNKVHVANPADINAFEKQAPNGSLYVEFDVPSNTISKGGTDGWGIINGPGSLDVIISKDTNDILIIDFDKCLAQLTVSNNNNNPFQYVYFEAVDFENEKKIYCFFDDERMNQKQVINALGKAYKYCLNYKTCE